MPFVEFVVLPVISVATVVIAVAMFASPWCVRGLARARSRGRLTLFGRLGDRQQTRQMLAANSRLSQSHVPIALMFGNSVLWTVFGVASREVVMTLVNSIGVLLSSYFMLVFLLVSSPAEQRTLVIHSALALSWALGLVWYVWVRPESTQEMLEACATLGNIGVVVTIGMLASPLLDLVPNTRALASHRRPYARTYSLAIARRRAKGKVIRERSNRFLNGQLSFMMWLNSLAWTLYGTLQRNIYAWLPNSIGLALTTVQLLAIYVYREPRGLPTTTLAEGDSK